jgi:ABC-type phosphate transport system substrate-binding protein
MHFVTTSKKCESNFFTLPAIQSQSYPLKQSIYLGLVDDPDRLEVLHAFLNFGFSTEGQEILKGLGYWPLQEWEKLAQHTRMQCKHGMDLKKIQEYCGSGSRSLTIGGSDTVLPIALVWTEIFKLGCPLGVTLEGGGSVNGAHRVCGDFEYGTRVDVVRRMNQIFISRNIMSI